MSLFRSRGMRRGGLAVGLALLAAAAGAEETPFLGSQHPVPPLPPQSPPPPPYSAPPAASGNCGDQLHQEEHDGLAAIEIVNRCRAGKSLRVTYRGDSYVATFDSGGRAALSIGLFDSINTIVFDGADGNDKSFQVSFPGAATDVKVAILWDKPVRLDIHVIEPGKALGGAEGDLARDHPNADLAHGLGRVDLANDGGGSGIHLQEYHLKPPRIPLGGSLRVIVDYASRGDRPSGDYCGDGPLASLNFRIRTLVAGVVSEKNWGLGAIACDAQRFDRYAFRQDIPLPMRQGRNTVSNDAAEGMNVDAAIRGAGAPKPQQ